VASTTVWPEPFGALTYHFGSRSPPFAAAGS